MKYIANKNHRINHLVFSFLLLIGLFTAGCSGDDSEDFTDNVAEEEETPDGLMVLHMPIYTNIASWEQCSQWG